MRLSEKHVNYANQEKVNKEWLLSVSHSRGARGKKG